MRGFGLSKLAQEDVIEQNTPGASEEDKEKETVITCISDCMYCQNPEKTCMLNNVTMSQGDQGSFSCGQYSATEQDEATMMPGSNSPEQEAPVDKESNQAKSQMGLSKVKNLAQPQAPEQKMGLEKVKPQLKQQGV